MFQEDRKTGKQESMPPDTSQASPVSSQSEILDLPWAGGGVRLLEGLGLHQAVREGRGRGREGSNYLSSLSRITITGILLTWKNLTHFMKHA